MKKLFKILLTCIVTLGSALAVTVGGSGCTTRVGNEYKVFAPDGAPALSLYALSGEKYSEFSVSVVNAETINVHVSGNSPEADFAILPVNSAVKLLGSGETYRMLGTVTHGNLFLLKKEGGEPIETKDDLTKLVGKTVGVINLANVPGLTFKTILADNEIAFNELKDGVSPVEDKVNLKAVVATEVLPSTSDCDYFVAPEPAVSTKVKATGGKLAVAGSLQTLYGGESGYPQAVAVAKVSLLQSQATDKFVQALQDADRLLISDGAEAIVSAVSGWLVGDMKPTFTADNLSATVIENCGIKFVSAQSCKAEVLAYMQKVNAQSNNTFGTPTDLFFG